MFVCQCEAVTDRQISAAIAEGCRSVAAVAALTKAGTRCGACVPTLRDLVCRDCPSLATELPCDDVPMARPPVGRLLAPPPAAV